ncbi:MAG: 3-oxoacyl-[acyl-carrier-protein] synthase III C-terminal domain-containing protein [Dehalococcoidia bacterium]|nr:3-oxoacyl-[acyl-carrier-protein] synthase III C-terminal domain-containing protein [Dehalococcoidia bacterium]
MAGIVSYDAYVPWYRMKRDTIFAAMGWLNGARGKGEKAICGDDEDSITMAVGAAKACLGNLAPEKVDGVFFATTTAPYRDRQDAGIITGALDLRPNIRNADFTDSTKSGTAALLSAIDAVKAGSSKNIMVCAADCRPAKSGGNEEQLYGDAGAALLIGNEKVVATLEGFYNISRDFMGHWRAEYDRFEHASEDRFNRDIGYVAFIQEAIQGLLKQQNITMKDVSKVIFPGLYAREHSAICKKIGAEAAQIQDTMLETVGDAGSAQPLLMLVAALEEAKPGDLLLVASFGGGADALLFKVTDEINNVKGKARFKGYLNNKKYLDNYQKYLAFRNQLPIEIGVRGEEVIFSQVTRLYRERRGLLGLVGSKCKKCGTPQYPAQRICVRPDCGAIDQMEDYRFADKKCKVFSYTGDNLSFSINPPTVYGVVDFDGGGRFWFDIGNCELENVKIGMPLEMSFRRRYHDVQRGFEGYHWKAVPIRA